MKYDFDYFSGDDLKVPTKPSKPTLKEDHSSSDAQEYALAFKAYDILHAEYQKELAMFYRCKQDRFTEFFRELKKDYGLCEAEFDIIWREASDHAHSGGLNEVYIEFDRLCNFIKRYTQSMR